MKHPKRWQDCKPFVDALLKRGYVLSTGGKKPGISECMSAGIYLYMYELWQDGFDRRSADLTLLRDVQMGG